MKNTGRNALRGLHGFLYPPTCVLCHNPGHNSLDLCTGCLQDLPFIEHACHTCAVPLPLRSGPVCGACQQSPPPIDTALAILRYESPVDWLLKRLKFGKKLGHARLLGVLMARSLAQRTAATPDTIIPVPLHAKRLRERGFNQTQELARPIADSLGVPLDYQSITRVQHTPPQMELPAKARRKNVRGAFEASPMFHSKRVAIVDDIMTTGSTVNELAHSLKKAGAIEVQVWVCARAS